MLKWNSQVRTFLLHFRRRPAWCDRILYKSPKHAYKNVELHAEQTAYRSHPSYSISDHKPVTSEFTIRVSYLYCVFFYNVNSCVLQPFNVFSIRFSKIHLKRILNLQDYKHGKLVKKM